MIGMLRGWPKFPLAAVKGNGIEFPRSCRQDAKAMARYWTLLAVTVIPAAAFAAGPVDGMFGPEMYSGGAPGVMPFGGDPCNRGNIFPALKVVRAYRDNEVFAFKHFEGKELQISGRLVSIKRDKIVVNDQVVFDGFVALVTPDGKPPKPVGLEFRFPAQKLRDNPQLACDVAELYPGQFVTLRGKCIGPVVEGEYTAVIFEDATLAR
jgi:hypothetical protein